MHRYILISLLCALTLPVEARVEITRAIVDVPDITNAISLTKELDARKGEPIPEGVNWFEIKRGTLPVIVTAPHATRPFREGEYRFADGGATGALAAALHAICGITAVYTTYDSSSDPNFYDDNEFKASLAELITEVKPVLLLDVHASHPYRPYDVDLGTMKGASVLGDALLVPSLADSFAKQGVLSISLDWFSASRNRTIIKFGSARGVPSVQLELSKTRMDPDADDLAAHRYAQVTEALVEFLSKRQLCTRTQTKDTGR